MSKKSGASISISESTSKEYGRVWRYVQIRGGGRAVDRAKKLLHIRLERLEPRALDEGDGGELAGLEDGGELGGLEAAELEHEDTSSIFAVTTGSLESKASVELRDTDDGHL